MTRPVDPSTPEATTKVLEKVRALLAKAESTEFAEEAAAFTAKAQAIMAAHSITLAMLEGASPDDGPASLRIVQEAPYASQKSTLLSAIARPNQCRVVWDSRDRSSLVFGFEHDLAAVDLLFTSLLVQAGIEMLAAERAGHYDRDRIRSFRASFYIGFAMRVGERLQAIRDDAERDASDDDDGLLPVLASRDELVERAMHEEVPNLRTRQISLSNGAGYRAGTVAGDKADLGPKGARLRRAG